MASRKKKRQPDSAAHTLDELQARGDRLAEWANDNSTVLLAIAVAVLAVAGVIGLIRSSERGEIEKSSADYAQAVDDYRRAMGAKPADLEVTEPANAETGRRVRSEYIERFEGIAEEHAGTKAGALAAIEAGNLLIKTGNLEGALAQFEAARDGLPDDDAIRALAIARVGSTLEALGRTAEAADAYLTAADIEAYPLAETALADAIRCLVVAGENERALGVSARLAESAPDYTLDEPLKARLAELRFAQEVSQN